MKTFKKLGLGIGVLLLTLVSFFIFSSKPALAAALTKQQAQDCMNNLQFVDFAHIKCSVDGISVTFTDPDPANKGIYVSSIASAATECQNHQDVIDDGISHFNLSNAGSAVFVEVTMWYGDPACHEIGPIPDVPINTSINSPQNITTLLAGTNKPAATSLHDVTGKPLAGLSYLRLQNGAWDPNQGSDPYLFGSGVNLSNGVCSGSVLAISQGGLFAKEFHVSTSGSDFGNFSELGGVVNPNNCKVSSADFGLDESSTPRGFNIYPAVTSIIGGLTGTPCEPSQTAPPGYTCSCPTGYGIGAQSCTLQPSGGGGVVVTPPDTSACVANSHTSLEWLLCPMTTAISNGADAINSLIESQLHFNVNGNLLANGNGIHAAWSIIKDIASSLVVILLLVMVISQAFGGGPFEAYTIRKMLPKLVIAVIAMQLSWEICRWLIGLANDLGDGIKGILFLPFQGAGNMDLNSILHRLSPGWAAAFGSPIGLTTLFVGGAIVIGFLTLPATFVMIFGLFVGIFAALMVLLFRNVLVVALTLFSPLAFLAWTLSGTEGLWKIWKSNFAKLLMLFPLILTIIYTGRIFAWIVAETNRNNNGQLPGFIDVLTILIAYFGPYFIIFKAYKWGGSLLNAAGSGIANARKGIVNANAPWLKTMGERAQGNLADRWNVTENRRRELRNRIDALNEAGRNKTPEQKRRLANAEKELSNLGKPGRFGITRKAGVPLPYVAANRDWWRRAALRVGAGTPIPNERQKVETLAKAGAYREDLVKKKEALIATDYVEELDRTGDVSGSKAYIERKYGMENYEKDAQGRIRVDNLGRPVAKDKYTERAFNNWVVDTQSWMELGDEDWRMGARTGKISATEFMPGGAYDSLNRAITEGRSARVVERVAQSLGNKKDWVLGYASDPTLTTQDILLHGRRPKFDIAKTPGFLAMMNSDPQRYRLVAEKLPLLQPFHQEIGGGPKRTDFAPSVVDGSTGATVQRAGARADPSKAIAVDDYMPGGRYYAPSLNPTNDRVVATRLAQERSDRVGKLAAEDARYTRWLSNLEHPTDLGTVRAEHYNLMRDMAKGMKEYGMSAKSPQALKNILDELAQSNSMEGKSIMQRLMGGEKSARQAIDGMFGHGYLEDRLGVRVRVPTSAELELEPEMKTYFVDSILTGAIDPRTGRSRLSPAAVDYVKSLAGSSSTRRLLNKGTTGEQRQLLQELHDVALENEDLSKSFNALIDQAAKEITARADDIVIQAAAAGTRTAAEVSDIRQKAKEAADAQIADYQRMKINPTPVDTLIPDKTVMVVPHNAPAPPTALSVDRPFVQDLERTGQTTTWMESKGGARALSDADLVLMYNVLRGANQQTVKNELIRRGLMSR